MTSNKSLRTLIPSVTNTQGRAGYKASETCHCSERFESEAKIENEMKRINSSNNTRIDLSVPLKLANVILFMDFQFPPDNVALVIAFSFSNIQSCLLTIGVAQILCLKNM
ncbi:hypothetical protein TNIN_387561 [Trichonephila inaurata madagascariensis]|uniref:Uncharacterized protein n=1 Tax=Trichonephila inaurata madagascariensis TaxID=2747483 RepID=A0A8X6X4R4_9ARAC|nr:hypothetical protein TNIN_387561 [Trichonephila inaurata madagascariensis]